MRAHVLLPAALSSVLALACGSDPGTAPGPDAQVSRSFTLAATTPRVPILQGTAVEVEVTVARQPGFTGAITVNARGLPPGVTAAPLAIADGETRGTLALAAAAAAAHSLPTAVELVGTALDGETTTAVTVTVYGPPGSVDTSFAGGKVVVPAGESDDYAYAVAVQADGKLVVGGRSSEHLGDFALVRFTRDGELDTSFGTGGKVLTDFAGASDAINALAVQPDGKLVAAGRSGNDFALARYNPDGTLDASFGAGGKVTTSIGADADTAYALVVAPDGTIVVGGDTSQPSNTTGVDFALARYQATGALDGSFGTGGIAITSIRASSARDSIYALALAEVDGERRIVAAGGEGDFALARYRANGQLDASFGAGGKVTNVFGSVFGAARALQVTAAGELVVAGHDSHDFAVARFTAAGALDPSFGGDGKVTTAITSNFDEAQALALDPDGALVVAGWTYEGGSSSGNFAVVRYADDGALDPTFGPGGTAITPVAATGKNDQAMALALQPDDRVPAVRVVVAGYASTSNSDFAIARYWR